MTFVQPLAVFADVLTPSNAFVVNPDYLIGSASNADPYGIATMELTDEDYGISLMSSMGSVSNTVDLSKVRFFVVYDDASAGVNNVTKYFDTEIIDKRLKFSALLDSGDTIDYYGFRFEPGSLPPAGGYSFSFDITSDVSVNYSRVEYTAIKSLKNASQKSAGGNIFSYCQFSSGDVYASGMDVDLINLTRLNFAFYLKAPSGNAVGGSAAFRFVSKDVTDSVLNMPDVDSSVSDYENNVSDSLSDLSSSMSDLSSSMDSASESLQYISTSQNLIIQGIDNVIMHISDQLYAFWDQLYNLIHEPTYARMGDILDAIRNLDLEITVEMTEVTNAVNKMNQEVQNKLQQTTDKITGGFDNSVMESEANKLDTSISEYDEAEQSVIQNVNDSLDNFEFDAELGEYQSIVSVISDFLQELYDSSGGFKVLINLSMLLSLAGIVIGIYRFGGGS